MTDRHPLQYAPATDAQVVKFAELNAKMRDAYDYLKTLPETRERSLAITKIEEASMWANKCISFHVNAPAA